MGVGRRKVSTNGESSHVLSKQCFAEYFVCRYAFAKAHKVLMIDEFDFIEQELLKFRAFSPSNFRARVAYLQETFPTIWTIKTRNGKIERLGELKDHNRAHGVAELTSRFAHALPDMEMVYNGHDGARIALAYEERHRLELLAKAHQCQSADSFLSLSVPFPDLFYSLQSSPMYLRPLTPRSAVQSLTILCLSSVLLAQPCASRRSITGGRHQTLPDSRCHHCQRTKREPSEPSSTISSNT